MTGLAFERDVIGGHVVFGAGSRSRLADEADRCGATKIVVVAGASDSTLVADVVATLGARVVGRFTDVVQHVPVAKANQLRAMVSDTGADAVVTIGGGSATGFGKAASLEADVVHIALPTTYAGSEMTSIWGLTDGGRKMTGRDPRVQPDVVVYDPELTLTLPPDVAGPSGMNALAHCVEALYGARRRPDHIGARDRGCPRLGSDAAPCVSRAGRPRRSG